MLPIEAYNSRLLELRAERFEDLGPLTDRGRYEADVAL